jgi:EmrB/QacA subfamily drug resistance transporter
LLLGGCEGDIEWLLRGEFDHHRRARSVNEAAPGPASIAALRDAVLNGREPPPALLVARLPSYRWWVVGTVCIGAFMGQVDSSIAQMLLPTLEREFDTRLSTVSWVAVGYLLTMAAFLPIFGRLADMVGRKLLYTAGFLLFVLGSALCGFAPNLPLLIAFRVLQAIGAALLSSNSVAIVVAAAGPERRGRALGIQSAAQAIGLSAGPAIGGLIMDTLGWQWVFWINVPVGLVGAVIGWLVIPLTKDLPRDIAFDWKGACLIVPALTAFMAVLNEGHALGVTSPALIGCALLAVILLALFVRAERRAAAPLVDLDLFRSGTFVAGNIAGLLSYAALFGLMFLMPFMFARVYGDSALAAGLRLSIVPVTLGLIAPVGGALSDWLGSRIVTVSGMLICVAGLGLLFVTLDGASGSLPLVMAALAIFGLGQGLFISPNNSALMAAAPARLTGEAGGLLNVMRSLGISTGIAAATSLLSWRLTVLAGAGPSTLQAQAHHLVSAGGDVVLLLGGFTGVAAAISLVQDSSRAPLSSRSR